MTEPLTLAPRSLPARLLGALPGLCAICRGFGAASLCTACRARFTQRVPRCDRCAIEVPAGQPTCGECLRTPPPQDAALVAVRYAEPWSSLIGHFKFHAALDLAAPLAQLIVDAAIQGAPCRPDWVLPVPLAPARLRERGYNQAWELARRVARRLALRSDPALLLRLRETPHQLALDVDARAANMRSAFAIEPLRRAELADRSVALVDDVMTTGATAGEIARTLRQAGARHVQLWLLARTPRPTDGG